MTYVLIPAHNNRESVLTVLDCLSRQTYQDFKVVLVDDGSTDGTYDTVKKQFPDTIILKGDGNLWWTGANVLGVEHILNKAKPGDFVLLLNNDLTVGVDYLSYLVNTSVEHGRAIVGSTLADANNPEYLEAGLKFDSGLNITANIDKTDINGRDFDANVDIFPGRGTLVPVEVFERIGNFDAKKLPHYGADYEFTVRAKRAGFKLICSHKARVYADLDTTGFEPSDKSFISMRECFKLLFSRKSKINLVYYLSYIWLCSDKGYKLRNSVYGMLHVLSYTVLKTIPAYPFKKFVFQPLLAMFRFFFKAFPLRVVDIKRLGLDPPILVKFGIISQEYQYRGASYYKLVPKRSLEAKLASLSSEDRERVGKLQRLSTSYLYKLKIFWRI